MTDGQEQQQAAELEVVRRADSYEVLVGIIVTLSDEFPAFDFDDFAARVVEAVQQYTVFRLSIVERTVADEKGAPGHYWVRVPAAYWAQARANGFVAREPWHGDAEVDTNADTDGLVALDGTPLARVRVSTAPDGARCRVRIVASHCIADGRTLASLFDVVRTCVPGEPPCVLRDTPLGAYGQRANFSAALPEAALHAVPHSWAHAVDIAVPARLSPEAAAAAAYVEHRWRSPTAPLRAYLAARRGRASLQGVLMAVLTRALRRCGGLAPAQPVTVWVPADLRASPYASPAFRTRAFFSGNGGLFPLVRGQDDIDADIAHCTAQVRAAFAGTDGPVHMCLNALAREPADVAGDAPALFAQSPYLSLIASNIGVYANMRAPRVQVHAPVLPVYCTTLYAYRGALGTDTEFMFFCPDVLDPRALRAVKDELHTVLAHISAHPTA